MIDSIAKLVPLSLMLSGGYFGFQRYQPVLATVERVAVQMELNEISKVLIIDQLENLVPQNQEIFADYLRSRMRVREEVGRDTAFDRWGTAYRLLSTQKILGVQSAGPDKVFDTADDLTASYSR